MHDWPRSAGFSRIRTRRSASSALISRPAYADLTAMGEIDVAISPQTVTIGSLLAYVRRGDVVQVHSLRRGAAEAMETIAHGLRGGGLVPVALLPGDAAVARYAG